MAACSNVQSTTKRGGLIENTDFFDSIDPCRTFNHPHLRPVADGTAFPHAASLCALSDYDELGAL